MEHDFISAIKIFLIVDTFDFIIICWKADIYGGAMAEPPHTMISILNADLFCTLKPFQSQPPTTATTHVPFLFA